MSNLSEQQQIIDLFEQSDDFLLTSHMDPDGDSIGSLIGLADFLEKLGKRVVIFNEGRLPAKYKFLDPGRKINFAKSEIGFEPKVAIVLECPEYERIGFVQELINESMTVVNVDHHPRNRMYGAFNYVDESACAVAEILYEIIKINGHKITARTAEAFYAAVASDTGRFKFTNTDSKCFKTASELAEAGANPKVIADKLFSSYSSGAIKLLGHLLQSLEMKADGRVCILKLRLADLQKYNVMVEDTEGIVDYSLIIEGVKIGLFFKERDAATVKVSMRSQNGIDISTFAINKGGGGHANAAGFTINLPLDETVRQVVDEVTEFLNG
jgi:bifunctional oligoribonuclease and PAP phosphatase NrnA